ncbi:tetratricopeptide repeat protein [Labilibacter sediminis]|nr:tetratricopeptide repeat protein [Labilibacter sediminis]
MRKILYFLLAISVLSGCKTLKDNVVHSNGPKEKVSVLSAAQKRKFDYFFYEGQRLKMLGNIDKAKMYFIECLKVDSLSSTSYYELANIEINNQNYKGAQDLLSNSVRLSPDNKWYKILLGDLYQQNENIPKSIEVYESLVTQFPNSDEFTYILAQLYYKNKDYDKAIETYNILEKSIGINEVISLEKEKIYLEIGKKGLAYKEVEKLIEENPYEPRYYGFMGDVYMYNKELDKAEESYRKILELDPDNGLGYFSLANISLQRKDTLSFFNNFSKALNDNDLNLEVKFQRMLPFLMGNDFKNYAEDDKITSLFEQLTSVHNDDSRSHIYYANYLQNNDNKEKALEEYKKALVIDKSNPSVWQDMFFLEIDLAKFELLYVDAKEALLIFPDIPLFNLFHAMGAMQKEEYRVALKSLEHGIQFTGDNINLNGQFHSYLGDVLYNLKRPEEAFKSYQNALKVDENNVVVLNNYSYYLSVENQDLDKAERMISKCIELEPGNSTYLDTYAWVLFKRGRFFEAKYIIERAIDNGGDTSDVIVEHYGDILYKNEDIDGAVIQWKKSLEMGNKSEILTKKIELEKYVEE